MNFFQLVVSCLSLGAVCLACATTRSAEAPEPTEHKTDPYAGYARVLTERAGTWFPGETAEIYAVKVPPGKTIDVQVPAACLDFRRKTPSHGEKLQLKPTYLPWTVSITLDVYAFLLRRPELLTPRIESRFDMARLRKDIASGTTADLERLQELTGQLEAITQALSRMQRGPASPRSLNELARGMQQIAQLSQAPPSKRTIRNDHDVTRFLVTDALQYALWFEDDVFVKKYKESAPSLGHVDRARRYVAELVYQVVQQRAQSSLLTSDLIHPQ